MGCSNRCKVAGKKLSLTWFEPRQSWTKKREGKTKYFKHRNTATGYQKALAECSLWLASLDEPPDPRQVGPKLRSRAQWCADQSDPEGRRAAIVQFLDVSKQMGLPVEEMVRRAVKRPDIPETFGLRDAHRIVIEDLRDERLWKERLKRPSKGGISIEQAVEIYIGE